MQSFHQRVSITAAVVLTMTLAATVRGEADVVEAYSNAGGLTRDSLSDVSLAQSNPTRKASAAHRRKAETDPKDFVSSHPYRRHHEVRQTRPQVTVTKGPKRRNPVASFVFWWNGWVIRTFHTNVGTVMLGTVGAKS